jgi:hypothetical protein
MARPVGSWRIVEMELWDSDAIELLGPAFIELKADGTGSFRFNITRITPAPGRSRSVAVRPAADQRHSYDRVATTTAGGA